MALASTLLILVPGVSRARDFRVNLIPNGVTFRCSTCHISPAGGGSRNAFGSAVGARVSPGARTPFWDATLAALDSDGDGFTNGEELGDPDGDGTPIAGWKATNPGVASSKPVNQVPSIVLAPPLEGTQLSAPAVAAVTASASDADGTVTLVEFFSNGLLLGSVGQEPFRLLVDWPPGAHTVTARVTDNLGATATSAEVALVVNAPAPTSVGVPVRAGGGLELAWTGGGGPFAVQGRSGVDDPWCTLADVTADRAATVAARGGAAMLRVADLAIGESIPLSVVLSGEFEVPNAVTTTGAGSGTLKITGSTLTFDIEYGGLTGPATAAHIHGKAGVELAAGVLIDLKPFNGGGFGSAGTLSGSVILTPEQKAVILSGKSYVNVHTAANGAGEIRGQVVPVLMQATLAGANERPTPVVSPAWGGGYFLLAGDELTFQVTYSGLSGPATAAHIHGPADADLAAGVMVDLSPFNGGGFGVAGSLAGTLRLTPGQLSAVVSGRAYVNIHTDANRAGELRGQIMAGTTATPFTVSLGGAFEKPAAVVTDGTGSGILALEGDTLTFHLGYSGLSGPATAAHIHGPADVGATAGVLIDLKPFNGGAFDASGVISGSVRLTEAQKTALLSGLTYVNFHTDANKSGEVRGQVIRPDAP